MEEIIANNLCKIYNMDQENEVVALSRASFTISEGEFVVILGASGAGKSTLLNILGGMDVATSGSYMVRGEDVAKFNARRLGEFRRKDVGFVFQFYNLMQNLTALENVQPASSVSEHPFDEVETLEKVGLAHRKENFPSQLSGGEQQRVAIARALVKNPALLLCDEPTGALDSKTGGQIISLLVDVAKTYKKTVIMVTHNAKIADCAHRLIRIADGKIIANEINEHPISPEEIVW